MQGKYHRACHKENITFREGQTGGHIEADEEQPGHTQKSADPALHSGFPAKKQSDDGHDNHVQTGDESGFSGGVGEVNPHLLEPGCRKQRTARTDSGDDGGFRLLRIVSVFLENQADGNQRQRSQPEPSTVEGERFQMVGSQCLCRKSKAPHYGGCEAENDSFYGILLIHGIPRGQD